MELIEWSDQFATGISGIDTEHKELISTINSFYLKVSKNTGKEELVRILNNIYATIHAHFMLEERLMQKYKYDAYQAHKTDHDRLLDEIREITNDLEQSSELDEQQLRIKLHDWFLLHFKTHDSRLHKLEQLIVNKKSSPTGFISSLFSKLFSK